MAAKNETLWGTAVLAAGLFVAQSALADSDLLTVRYLLTVLAIGITALILMQRTRRSWRDVSGPAPEPVSLALAGLVALSLWALAWWLMAVIDQGFADLVGVHPMPHLLGNLSDALIGIDLQPAAYELQILFAVVLVPLVQSWLLWGLLQPALTARLGTRCGVWVTGAVAGTFLALTAVQNVAAGTPAGLTSNAGTVYLVLDVSPEMPWGTVSLAGYLLIGMAAAWAVALSRSLWAGFAALGTFAYLNFALRDDLSRHFGGESLSNIEWLTLVVLGALGTVVFLQVIRFRRPRAQEPAASERRGVWPHTPTDWLPLALLLIVLAAMIALDLNARG
jgi:hypothetical protein